MDCDGASASRSSTPALELYKCRHFELYKREIGSLRPSLYAHRIGGCEDMVQRLKEFRRLSGHRGCVNTVHFNPSGDRLVSGSDDKQIIFWDWMAGRKKLIYHSGHEQNVFQARIMPFSDDRSVVSCAADGQVRHALISEDGRVETKKLAKHRGPAHKLAVEPGSPRTFFSCGEDGIVLHFDLRDNRRTKLLSCQNRFKSRGPLVRLNSIVINPRNPNYLAVGGDDVYARVYDLRKIGDDTPVSLYTPKHLIGFPHIHITCVAYSHQEELLVSYSDEHIYLFQRDMEVQDQTRPDDDSASDEEVNSDTPDCDDEIDTSIRKKDGDDDAEDEDQSGDMDDDKEKSSAADDGRSPQVYRGHRNAQTVKGVNFYGPNSEYVMSGSDCGHIFIWKKRGGALVTMLKGDRRVVNCLEPHPHTAFLATSGMDKTIKLWAPTSVDREPFPPNADKIMERNKRSREDLSNVPFTPEIIMRVLHLQSARFVDPEAQNQDDAQEHNEEEGYYNLISTENSDEDSSDDSLGSPRECIIS
ncbi:DDB1- and CUL4-associated factor 8-like protein 2 [Selaginella moellendorffii]|uniref:DDB1- and CUL4-associated factor 8-like protein 2 n=1 Tax=Selaginella moellendorffii TaxID=88036 RepID=UPI000D1C43B9|nr:DDB1- and CUL4-associated factor 8-like protein 2 [Selaginella moellendorffii]|eukprot:XP_024539173.1 DDB1- and CUL4-associated factor 8-like protein 2 [Selaginella moellendorffii]